MRKFFLGIVTLLAMLSSCNDDVAVERNGLPLTRSATSDSLAVNTSFIKLADDTTRFEAGFLEITAPTQEVSIKWNVLPEFNIDTTATTIQMQNGKISLPIKWKKCLKTHYHAPKGMVFEGGVIVKTGDQAKYVRLILSEKIDSVKLNANPVIMDSPEAPYPMPRIIIFDPPRVRMQTSGVTGVYVTIGGQRTMIEYYDLGVGTNVDQANVNPGGANNILEDDKTLFFQWANDEPPSHSFIRGIDFTQGGNTPTPLVARLYVEYKAPNAPLFILKSVLPDNEGFISGKDGFVTVVAETDGEWSISSGFNADAGGDIEDNDITPMIPRTLIMPIKDNDGPTKRRIPIISKSRGVEQNTTYLIQQGGDPRKSLVYQLDNIDKPIPKAGGSYKITFEGDYEGPLLVRPVIAGAPGIPGPVTNTKTAEVTVPENPTTVDRNITFEFSVDGENWVGRRWAAVSPETDRIQLGTNGGEAPFLKFVDSNLPDGNIPQPGELYTFIFEGTYHGRLRIRAQIGATSYTGEMANAGNFTPTIAVPENLTTTVRPVKFQYRPFDATDAALNKWTNFPEGGITKDQDANTTPVIHGELTPQNDIPDDGGRYSCAFTGNYPGNIIMRATEGETEIIRSTGKVNTTISVDIPKIVGSNRTVTFEYSLDGNEPWISLGTRNQKHETVVYGELLPTGDIPFEGGTYTIKIRGTFSKKVTVRAKETSSQGPVVVEETSTISPEGHTFKLVIPKNSSDWARSIGFSYQREDQAKETLILIKQQNGKY